jgi:4-hydroxy-tetrahydrodipicolinate reductase
MGQTIARLIADADDLIVEGGIAPVADGQAPAMAGYPQIRPVEEAGELVRHADVVIDFSAPAHLRSLLDLHAGALEGRALVVGTTGLEADLEASLDETGRGCALLVAANFSIGVNLLLGLAEQAARALPQDGYDVEIVEAHHGRKEDAPSGTALELGRAVARGRGVDLDAVRRDGRSGRPGARPAGEIGFHALRGGGVVGEHTVHFLGTHERLILGHSAGSRELFAAGALVAARWLSGQGPGRYSMAQVLGLGR